MMFLNFSSSSLRQWFATLCCSFGSGLTASSVMAYNSILVESLQKDPDTNFTFEETSWFCKNSDSRSPLEFHSHFSFVLGLHCDPWLFCWRNHLRYGGKKEGHHHLCHPVHHGIYHGNNQSISTMRSRHCL